MPNRPKVSVITITYNHEKFIKQALESIVSQVTDFDFEVIVADDYSTDVTQKIIREYATKYPDIVKPILRKKNIGAQLNFKDAIQTARGEYIALCEGDDYWTNSEKLQLQADFLDSGLDYSLCFHPVNVHFDKGEEKDKIFPIHKTNFTLEALLEGNFIQTNSVMYRKQDYEDLPVNILPLDWYLHLFHAQFGKIGFVDKVMSTYRRHEDGIWWRNKENQERFWLRNGILHLRVYEEIYKIYGGTEKYANIIFKSVLNMYDRIFDLKDSTETRELQKAAVSLFPDLMRGAYLNYKLFTEGRLTYASSEMERLHKDLEHSQHHRFLYEERLKATLNSKAYRVGNVVTHPKASMKAFLKRFR